jgi:hypothetical protein
MAPKKTTASRTKATTLRAYWKDREPPPLPVAAMTRYLEYLEMKPGGGYTHARLDMHQARERVTRMVYSLELLWGSDIRLLANKNIHRHLTGLTRSGPEEAAIPMSQVVLLSSGGAEVVDLLAERTHVTFTEPEPEPEAEPLPQTRDEALYSAYDGKAGF